MEKKGKFLQRIYNFDSLRMSNYWELETFGSKKIITTTHYYSVISFSFLWRGHP
jgi:hypothetical protein